MKNDILTTTQPQPSASGFEMLNLAAQEIDPVGTLMEVLETIPMKGQATAPFSLTSPWGIHADNDSPCFYYLTQGQCRMESGDFSHPLFLVQGDLVILTHGKKHTLRHSSLEQTIPFSQLFASHNDLPPKNGTNESASLICGLFSFDSQTYNSFLSSLPPLIHLREEERTKITGMDNLLHMIVREAESNMAGSWTIVNRLINVLFIQVIRYCVTALPLSRKKMMPGLMDPEIGPTLRLIHQHPELPWTVASLAEKAFMSRSVFAAKFSSLVGRPPLHYLNECRMMKACALLRETPRGIHDIALAIGYSSEAAFSNAFKRWKGIAPGHYRKASDSFSINK
jgi:AraC-like DNA-binding protein